MTLQLEKFKAGRLQAGTGYKYFLPEKINVQWQWTDAQLNTLLEKASIRLGELNSYARLVPNIDLFIALHVTKEAVISSRIEGTQTNIAEAVMPEEEINPERRNDWKEVNNYIKALNEAIISLSRLPLSSRLLRQAHLMLLRGVRGEYKQPGQFRTSQNWIGGSGPVDAVFVPPAHAHGPCPRRGTDGRLGEFPAQRPDKRTGPYQNRHSPLSIRNHTPISGRQRAYWPIAHYPFPCRPADTTPAAVILISLLRKEQVPLLR